MACPIRRRLPCGCNALGTHRGRDRDGCSRSGGWRRPVAYAATGAAIGLAAALQSAARPNSVLVGTATRAATEGIFEWGPSHQVPVAQDDEPLLATYLGRPLARPVAEVARRGLAARAPLVGRRPRSRCLWRRCGPPFQGGGGADGLRGGRPGEEPPRRRVPELFHGLGGGGVGTPAAVVGRPMCLLRPLRPMAPTSNCSLGSSGHPWKRGKPSCAQHWMGPFARVRQRQRSPLAVGQAAGFAGPCE